MRKRVFFLQNRVMVKRLSTGGEVHDLTQNVDVVVCLGRGGGEGGRVKLDTKSTLWASTRELETKKQTKPRPVASAAPHPITPAGGGG